MMRAQFADLDAFTQEKHQLAAQLDEEPDSTFLRNKLILEEQRFWRRYLRRCRVASSWRRKSRYKVSVIVSTYRSAEFIETCLLDIVQQSVADSFEIIVINAASPQDEWGIVERFRKRRANIVNVLTPERIGIYPAWNLAITIARGKYLTTCSTSDRVGEDSFRLLMQELEADPSIALVYGDSHVSDLPHQSMNSFIPAAEDSSFLTWEEYDYRVLLRNCGVGPHPMWRSALHQELGYFDCRYRSVSDQDFWLRVGWKYPMKHIPEFTGLFWKTPGGLSQHAGAIEEAAKIHAKYQQLLNCSTPPSLSKIKDGRGAG